MAEETMDIPVELQFRDVRKQNKVIVGKQSRQVLPQNGTDFTMTSTGQTQIIFRLPNDENASVDFNSMWICADLQVRGLDGTSFDANTVGRLNNDLIFGPTAPTSGVVAAQPVAILALGDSIESIISRVAVYVNGSELEREDYYNSWESFSNMHQNNANFSNSIGAGAMLMNMDIIERSRQLLVGATLPNSNTIQVAFPLRYLGIANLRSLIPTYLMGGGQSSIEIRIFLSSVLDSLTSGTVSNSSQVDSSAVGLTPAELWTPSTTIPTIELRNVRMNIDYVHTSDQYSSALREYLTSNSLTLPLKTYYQTIYQIPASASGWINHTVSTQFSDIEAVFCVFFNSSEQSSLAFLGSDRCHKPSSLISARLSINGQIYPAVPISFNPGANSQCAEAYQYLLKALFQNTSLEVIGNTNQKWVAANNTLIVYNNLAKGTSGATSYTALTTGVSVVGNYESKVGQGYYYGVDKRYVKNNAVPSPYTTATRTITGHNLIAEPEWFWDSPTQFGIGFDVSKSSYNDEYTLSGSDLSKTSGLIQVQLQFNGTDANAYNCLIVVQHKRLLEIGMDNAQVIY